MGSRDKRGNDSLGAGGDDSTGAEEMTLGTLQMEQSFRGLA
jgi:hypothetical protein